MKNKKLLIIGSTSIHTENFFQLMKEEFKEVQVISKLDFSLWSLSAQIRTPRTIRSIIKKFNPDIVHIHQVNSVAYYALRAL